MSHWSTSKLILFASGLREEPNQLLSLVLGRYLGNLLGHGRQDACRGQLIMEPVVPYEAEHTWEALLLTLQMLFVTPRNAIIVVSTWAAVLFIGKMLPRRLIKGYKERVLPAILVVACCIMVWLPGLRTAIRSVGWRLALGIILAVFAYFFPIFLNWGLSKLLPENVHKSIRKYLL